MTRWTETSPDKHERQDSRATVFVDGDRFIVSVRGRPPISVCTCCGLPFKKLEQATKYADAVVAFEDL